MQKVNKKILRNYASGSITKEEFESKFKYVANFNNFDKLLEKALNNYLEFNMLFWYLPTSMNVLQKDKIFKKYLSIKEAHQEHEEMLNYFHKNFIYVEDNLSILKSLIKNPPSYFKEAGRENVFKEKCLFTISKQPTLKAKDVLIKFSSSIDETIAKSSNLYLEKLAKNSL